MKSGQKKFKATFKAEKTGEYSYFNVLVTVQEAGLIEKIELISQVRESVSSIIHVENPTDGDVKILPNEIICTNEDIEIKPNSLTIPARSERGFEIYYRPLVASEEITADLTINSPILGIYKY